MLSQHSVKVNLRKNYLVYKHGVIATMIRIKHGVIATMIRIKHGVIATMIRITHLKRQTFFN